MQLVLFMHETIIRTSCKIFSTRQASLTKRFLDHPWLWRHRTRTLIHLLVNPENYDEIYVYTNDLRRVFIWHCLLIFFRPSKVTEHVTSRASGSWVQNKIKNLTSTLTLNLLLLLPSIVFYDKICFFIMIFTALSFLRLIHSLLIIWGGNVS